MDIFVRKAGLEPAMSLDDGFTVRSRSRWSTSECFVEPRGVEPRKRIFSPAHTPSLPKLLVLLLQMDSNHHLQIQNLPCLPLHHRAMSRRLKDSNL